MPVLDVGGARLFYTEEGNGPAVVFVHGIPTDYRAWSDTVGALGGRYRAVTYSRRYAAPNDRHGPVTDSTIENNAADLAGLIDRLKAQPVHLVGHSYGGFIAAYLAATRGDLLRSLVLVEPAIASLLLRNPRSRAEAIRLLFRRPRAAFSAARFLRTSNVPALRALSSGDTLGALRLNVDGVEDRVGSFGGLPESTQRMMHDNARTIGEVDTPYPPLSPTELKCIGVPTLVISGETSAYWLRVIARLAAASIPGSELVTIRRAGHFPHLEQSKEFNRQLGGFLDRHTAVR